MPDGPSPNRRRKGYCPLVGLELLATVQKLGAEAFSYQSLVRCRSLICTWAERESQRSGSNFLGGISKLQDALVQKYRVASKTCHQYPHWPLAHGIAPMAGIVVTKQNIPPALVNDGRRQIATPLLEQGAESPDTPIVVVAKSR